MLTRQETSVEKYSDAETTVTDSSPGFRASIQKWCSLLNNGFYQQARQGLGARIELENTQRHHDVQHALGRMQKLLELLLLGQAGIP